MARLTPSVGRMWKLQEDLVREITAVFPIWILEEIIEIQLVPSQFPPWP